MKWSWQIGKLAGIPLRMHATFFLIIVWVVFLHAGRGTAATLEGVAFVLLLFACVVLHELGHALTARRYGIRTRSIVLLPIGGVARLEKMPDKPSQELLVALAGPAVNVVIAAVLYAVLTLSGHLVPMAQLDVEGGPFWQRMMLVNVMLVVFNLLPAFPMDGGRVLRALLALATNYNRATQIAAVVGQAMAMLFGLLGLLSKPFNPFLLLIAAFVWIGASQEASWVQIRTALAGIPVHQAMLREYHTLEAGDHLGHAMSLILAGSQQDFPVVDGDRKVTGILTRHDLMRGLHEHGENGSVESTMHDRFQTTHATETLESAFVRLQRDDSRTMPVLDDQGQLTGLLTSENVGEFLMIHAALDRASRLETA